MDKKDTAAEDRQQITANGWTQGAVIESSEDVGKSFDLPEDGCDAYVLVSHSCDVLAYKYDAEPLVEFIGGKYSPKENKSVAHRRHPRQLQLPIDGGRQSHLTINIKYRYLINRNLLVNVPASKIILVDDSLLELQMWMAARYRRTAFPDTYIERVSDALSEIHKKLKSDGDQGVHGLYIYLDPFEELQAEQEYHVVIMGTADEQLGEAGSVNWRAAEDFLEYMANQLDACEGVTVREWQLLAEDGITLATLKRLKLLDFDYISHRDRTEVPELVG